MYPEVVRMALNKRTEVLFDEVEYEKLRREAARRGVSVGELVREAVRRAYLHPSDERRRAAFEWMMHGPEVDIGTWEDVKDLIGRWVDREP
jgi:hypothetical protein